MLMSVLFMTTATLSGSPLTASNADSTEVSAEAERPCDGCPSEEPAEPDDDSDCHEDCTSGCCMSHHAPASAHVAVAHYTSHPIDTPYFQLSPDGEAARGFGDRIFQPPRC